jgi:hypothetical protein
VTSKWMTPIGNRNGNGELSDFRRRVATHRALYSGERAVGAEGRCRTQWEGKM